MGNLSNIALIFTFSSFFFFFFHANAEENILLHNICEGQEKVAKFEIYVHDLRVGNPTPTVYEVATASITSNSPTSFGRVHVVDDPVTAGPSIDSAPVGRIQGLTTSADLSVSGVALNLNFVFTAGRLNGSTISILGRNQVANAQRELVVAGGTGFFQFARGYAVQTTSLYDTATFYGVFKYTIYTTYNSKFGVNDDDVVAISAM